MLIVYGLDMKFNELWEVVEDAENYVLDGIDVRSWNQDDLL